MDRNFQQKAYSALSDNKKEALLKNARLKDESTLQDSGMSNLENRLLAQNTESDNTLYDLYQLSLQEERARENIGDLLNATNKTANSIKYVLIYSYLCHEQNTLRLPLFLSSISLSYSFDLFLLLSCFYSSCIYLPVYSNLTYYFFPLFIYFLQNVQTKRT